MVVAAGAPVVRLAHDGPRDVVFAVPEDKVALVQSIAARRGSVQVRLWSNEREELRRRSARSGRCRSRHPHLPGQGRPWRRRGCARRLGQTATVAIPTPRLAGIARVPLSALKEHQGGSSVWIVDPASMTAVGAAGPDRRRRRQRRDRPRRPVSGRPVVTAGVHVLQAGQKVCTPTPRRRWAAPRRRCGSAAPRPRRRICREPSPPHGLPPRRRCDQRGAALRGRQRAGHRLRPVQHLALGARASRPHALPAGRLPRARRRGLLPARPGRGSAVHLPGDGDPRLLARRDRAAGRRAGGRQARARPAGGALRRPDPQRIRSRARR